MLILAKIITKTRKWTLALTLTVFLLLIAKPLTLQLAAVLAQDIEVTDYTQQIKEKKDKIEELEKRVKDFQDSIKERRSQAVTLANQIYILNSEIAKTEAETELTENQINATELEIKDTEQKIKTNEARIEKDKDRLTHLLQEIYKSDQLSYIEILLSNESLSDFFNQVQTLEQIEGETQKTVNDLQNFKAQLNREMSSLAAKKTSLGKLKQKLEDDKLMLIEQKVTKQNILLQTKNSENRFRSLLDQAKAEQASINADIVSLEKQIRERLAAKDKEKLRSLGNVNLIWPVPQNTITATFHDPDYPFRYIFEHPAIDIRAAQGTAIKAPASGYVARVKDGGYGYSYIMLIHNDGISTVFGHVSKIYVREEQFIGQGETIGISGGMPGTRGAGRLTTGPHLHFEVRQDGLPVNALEYLP